MATQFHIIVHVSWSPMMRSHHQHISYCHQPRCNFRTCIAYSTPTKSVHERKRNIFQTLRYDGTMPRIFITIVSPPKELRAHHPLQTNIAAAHRHISSFASSLPSCIVFMLRANGPLWQHTRKMSVCMRYGGKFFLNARPAYGMRRRRGQRRRLRRRQRLSEVCACSFVLKSLKAIKPG